MSRRKALAKREPNGRVQRDYGPSPTEIRRLRDGALLGIRDAMWGTELGRLSLVGKITTTMHSAGKRWAEMASLYSQALCSPSPDPKAVCLERMGGSPADPDSSEGRREARRHERAVASFIDAHVALKQAGRGCVLVVRSVCERNEMPVGHADLLTLSRGLAVLAAFWGLTSESKSDVR